MVGNARGRWIQSLANNVPVCRRTIIIRYIALSFCLELQYEYIANIFVVDIVGLF
jgi:hypothetical protein